MHINHNPFGMGMRNIGLLREFRYGFNDKEIDFEVVDDGIWQDYGMREFNARLCRFLSTDPLNSKYPELTTFQFSSNNPVKNIDLDGLEGYDAKKGSWISRIANETGTAFAITRSTYIQVQLYYNTGGKKGEAPKPGFTYIYTPYSDVNHPEVKGMSPEGDEGYQGFWYAEDLNKKPALIKAGLTVVVPSDGFGGSLDSWNNYGKKHKNAANEFISHVEKMIDKKQEEFNQKPEDVKSITIGLGEDIYNKSADGIMKSLKEKYKNATIQINKLTNNTKDKDSALSVEYKGTKTLKKK